MSHLSAAEVEAIAAKVERFVRDVIAPYEHDPRCGAHGPSEELVREIAREGARGRRDDAAYPGGWPPPHAGETATVLKKSGLSPLGPVAVQHHGAR
jgi:acyl-CoA dehydrogenase